MKEELTKTLGELLKRKERSHVIMTERRSGRFVQFVPKSGGILCDVPEQVGMSTVRAARILPVISQVADLPRCRQRQTGGPEEAAAVAVEVFDKVFGIWNGEYEICLETSAVPPD